MLIKRWPTGRTLDLQMFAKDIEITGDITETDGEDFQDIDDDADLSDEQASDQQGDADVDDLAEIIRKIKEEEAEDDENDDDPDDADNQDDVDDDQVDQQNQPDTQQQQEQEQEAKRVQTAEENARFADQRRQQQLEAQMRERPEFALAERLSKHFAKPVEQILADMDEAELQERATKENIPVEVLREQQRLREEREQDRRELLDLKFKDWNRERDAEGAGLIAQYPVLTQADINAAKQHMLTKWGTIDASLEEAVMAVHGQKILTYVQKSNKNEALAEVAGRKKGPLPPNGTKSTPTTVLNSQEKAWAKRFGMSDAEYIKWK